MTEKLTEIINHTITAIRHDEGRQMKMGSFCYHDTELCKTSYCLAGWLVMGQPTFSKLEILKELSLRYDDPKDQTWEQAMDRSSSLDSYLEMTADRMLSNEFDDDPNFNSFDLFYLHLKDGEIEQLNAICEKIGIGYSHDALSAFDALPRKVRMEAAIKVLEILRDEKKIDWLPAIRYAVEKHVCENSAW